MMYIRAFEIIRSFMHEIMDFVVDFSINQNNISSIDLRGSNDRHYQEVYN